MGPVPASEVIQGPPPPWTPAVTRTQQVLPGIPETGPIVHHVSPGGTGTSSADNLFPRSHESEELWGCDSKVIEAGTEGTFCEVQPSSEYGDWGDRGDCDTWGGCDG